jgi:hypothetical protein
MAQHLRRVESKLKAAGYVKSQDHLDQDVGRVQLWFRRADGETCVLVKPRKQKCVDIYVRDGKLSTSQALLRDVLDAIC